MCGWKIVNENIVLMKNDWNKRKTIKQCCFQFGWSNFGGNQLTTFPLLHTPDVIKVIQPRRWLPRYIVRRTWLSREKLNSLKFDWKRIINTAIAVQRSSVKKLQFLILHSERNLSEWWEETLWLNESSLRSYFSVLFRQVFSSVD